MGYFGKHEIVENCLMFDAIKNVISKAFHQAEELAHDEEGYLIKLKQVSFSEIWIPKTEASTLIGAYQKALEHVGNGYPIDRDSRYAVGSAEDDVYKWQCEIEYLQK